MAHTSAADAHRQTSTGEPILRRRRNVKTASENAGFFAVGRELESATVNHQFTEAEKANLAKVESIDYLPANSKMYREWLWMNPTAALGIHWDRWVMMGTIGFCIGLTGYFVKSLTELVNTGKYSVVAHMIDDDDVVGAWLYSTGYSVFFAVLSAAIVVYGAPAAAGSGIPEVIGYLNGCNIHNIFNIKTVIAKFFSVICAVGSGLPVGPEGPMIHLGAMLGAGISQGRSSTLGTVSNKISKYRNTKDRRDFITAGAAAGVATAFGAPVGGLLFGMEEVASFWDQTLLWQMFFACMIATFTIDLFASGVPVFHPQANFGTFEDAASILFLTASPIRSNLFIFIPAAIIGAIGGFLGAAFTFLNLKIARFRRRAIAPFKLRRIGEVALLMFVFGSISFFLPMAFNCSSIASKPSHISSSVYDCKGEAKSVCPESERAHVTPFFCAVGFNTEAKNITSYNEMASLMYTSAENGIHLLFSRHTSFVVGAGECLVMFFVYFLFCCWAAGSAVASGLVVPMLMVGANYGRAIGIGFYTLVELWEPNVADSYWEWVDPGIMALLGAAAFFGGVSRLTISLTVILLEITNDVRLLLPIMTSIITAKLVADMLTHSLYHALLEVKCVPFLPDAPAAAVSLDLFQVSDVMHSPVVCLPLKPTVREVCDVLKLKHHTFPVVDASHDSHAPPASSTKDLNPGISREAGFGARPGPKPRQVVLGSVSRDVLEAILQKWMKVTRQAAGQGKAPDEGEAELSHDEMTRREDERHRKKVQRAAFDDYEGVEAAAAEFKAATDSEDSWMDVIGSSSGADATSSALLLDLTRYINESQHAISSHFSLQRTYILYRTMGLRSLIVRDSHNGVAGIVTRKDLLGYKVEECIEPILEDRGLVGENTKFAGGHAPITSAHYHGHGHGGHGHGGGDEHGVELEAGHRGHGESKRS